MRFLKRCWFKEEFSWSGLFLYCEKEKGHTGEHGVIQ